MCSVYVMYIQLATVYKTVYKLVTVKMVISMCMYCMSVICDVYVLCTCYVRYTHVTTPLHSVRIMFVRILFVCIYVAKCVFCDVI